MARTPDENYDFFAPRIVRIFSAASSRESASLATQLKYLDSPSKSGNTVLSFTPYRSNIDSTLGATSLSIMIFIILSSDCICSSSFSYTGACIVNIECWREMRAFIALGLTLPSP